jgi:hypothetical protein
MKVRGYKRQVRGVDAERLSALRLKSWDKGRMAELFMLIGESARVKPVDGVSKNASRYLSPYDLYRANA